MPDKQAQVKDVDFIDALEQRYLAYALSTITSRSLPDVRDGLKPVHRRLLYAMLQLKLDPNKGFKKCARVVGDVIGKYHPHGDSAVYDAMVRMAQKFSLRCPLVEGQGNFGSIDGDSQAAMRYTEARLTDYAMLLLAELDSGAVELHDNYDGSEEEPALLPAMVPNILANGSEGIAVGMATSIPPHNIIELLDAILHLMKKPQSTVEDLLQYIIGPDFPTGGVLIQDSEALEKIYETGKGSLILQARWHKEELKNGQYQIVVTEIPYQVSKRQIIEAIAELYNNKKLPFIADFQDLSGEDIRIIFTPKLATIPPEALIASLYKLTTLQIKVHINMNVLDSNGLPRVMGLLAILQEFVAHRRTVTTSISRTSLSKVQERLEIVSGLLTIYEHLDEIIRILREEDEPKELIKQKWRLSDVQVEAILNMRLRAIRKLEEIALRQEHQTLMTQQDELNTLLTTPERLDAHIISNLKHVRKQLAKDEALAKRRTTLQAALEVDLTLSEIPKTQEPITILYSQLGWIRAAKGHQPEAWQYRAGDGEGQVIQANTADKLLCISNQGRVYTLEAEQISCSKGHGEPLKIKLQLQSQEEISNLYLYDASMRFIFISAEGKGFIANAPDLCSSSKAGKRVIKSAGKVLCMPLTGDSLALLGENRRLLLLNIQELPEMSQGAATTLQKYKVGRLADARLFNKANGLHWVDKSGKERYLANLQLWFGKRGDQGRLVLDKIWLDP